MKKVIALLLAAALLCGFAGCASHDDSQGENTGSPSKNMSKRDTLDALYGEWQSDDEKISISGSSIEITGYYEQDGQRLAGVVTVGRIKPGKNGEFTVDIEDQIQEGRLQDDNTLIIGQIEYRR